MNGIEMKMKQSVNAWLKSRSNSVPVVRFTGSMVVGQTNRQYVVTVERRVL